MWFFGEPFFFNSRIRTQTLQPASPRASLRPGHLMTVTATSTETLAKKSNITSIRLIHRVVEEVCAALPQTLRAFAEDVSLSLSV